MNSEIEEKKKLTKKTERFVHALFLSPYCFIRLYCNNRLRRFSAFLSSHCALKPEAKQYTGPSLERVPKLTPFFGVDIRNEIIEFVLFHSTPRRIHRRLLQQVRGDTTLRLPATENRNQSKESILSFC